MKSSVLQKISYTRADMDPDMAFCEHLRYQNIFMEAINLNYYGHLVNSENFDIKRTRFAPFRTLKHKQIIIFFEI